MRSPRKRRKRSLYAYNPDIRERISAFATDKHSLSGRYEPLTPEQRIALKSWANA